MCNPSRFVWFLSSFVLGFLLALPAQSETLSEIALFQRCYAQITNTRAKKGNPLFQQVANGQKSAVQACYEVLQSANLTANNNETIANQNDVQAKSVLSTFNKLHASWFGAKDFPVVSSQIRNRDDKNIYDASSPALYFTRALFKPATQVKSAVTTNENLIPYRTQMDPPLGADSGYAKADYFFDPLIRFAPMGELVGVHVTGSQNLTYPAQGKVPGGAIDINKHVGGGIMGSIPYLLLYLPEIKDDSYASDGGVIMPRRWGRAIYNDLLCRDIPVVRESDVTGLIDTKSTISFRTATACTKCHASQDRLASVVRNINTFTIGSGKSLPGEKVRGGIFPGYHATTKPPEAAWPIDPDPDYKNRPTNGTLYMRSYAGELIDKPVTSIADLGQKISETDDFYICIAKRYYSYFTGININNGDLADPGWAYKPTSGDLFHRDVVINLGKSLKTHQSLSQLILDILKLDHYKTSDFGVRRTGNEK